MRMIDGDALSAFVGDLRSTLLKEQSTFKAMTPIEFNTRDYMLLNFQQVIDNAPTVEQPTGEWGEVFHHQGYNYHKCSNCCFSIKLADYDNYCPNCGAKMKEETNNG